MGTYTLTTFVDAPSTSTPEDAANLNEYTFAINDLDTRVLKLELKVVGPKTANYPANPNEYVLFDTTSGSLTFTFPTAPPNGTQVGAKQTVRGGTNVVNLQLGGSDHFDTTTGATTGSMPMLNQGGVWQYVSAFAVWIKISDDLPLSQLDARYAPLNPSYSLGGSWSSNIYGTQFENMQRDDASATGVLMTSTTKTWVVLLGLCPASTYSNFQLYVTTAGTSSTLTAALFSASSLTSTSWARQGSGNVTPTISATGLVSTSLAFTLASPAFVVLEMVLTTASTFPAFLSGAAAVSAAFLNPSSGCPVFGTQNASTAPGATLNPTTGFTAGSQKIWCALA